jgi:hypothetical protein
MTFTIKVTINPKREQLNIDHVQEPQAIGNSL